MTVRVEHGDCLEVMPRLIAAEGMQIDSVVTDPPYLLGFMNKSFDRQHRELPGANGGQRMQTWHMQWAPLAYEILKPGGYIVAFSGTRTYHRMACALEDAGFIVHPMIGWIFGSGFPKATRLKAPDTDHLRYGLQALKPALEPICVGQKPMEGTGTENWLKHGTGALNVGACKIGIERIAGTRGAGGQHGKYSPIGGGSYDHTGRWPSNVIHDGSPEVLEAFAAYGERKAGGNLNGAEPSTPAKNVYGEYGRHSWQSHSDTGTVARFFYSAKADSDDRLGSKHPTVKPVDLIAYLCRLVTPPGGLVLDPFAGSGTTGMACLREGFRAVLIEREAEYIQDIQRRLQHVRGEDTPLFSKPECRATGDHYDPAKDAHDSYYDAIAALRAEKEGRLNSAGYPPEWDREVRRK